MGTSHLIINVEGSAYDVDLQMVINHYGLQAIWYMNTVLIVDEDGFHVLKDRYMGITGFLSKENLKSFLNERGIIA